MISIKLDGGLGNQMYQYAFIKKCSMISGIQFVLDTSVYQYYNTRGILDLDKFNIPKPSFCASDKPALLHRLFVLRLLRKTGIGYKRTIVEKGDLFNEKYLLNIKERNFYYGYFQSYKYFDDIKEQLQNDFTLRESVDSVFLQKIQSTFSVAIHVRRGDYVSNKKVRKKMALLDVDYYKKAIEFIQLSAATERLEYFIFTNEAEWVNTQLLPALNLPAIVVNHNQYSKSVFLDFECMRHAKYNIIANSSFSWWAAYLNKGSLGVVAPQKWYNIQKNHTENCYPKNWAVV